MKTNNTLEIKPLIIIIRDGWGLRKSNYKNAIKESHLNYTNQLMKKYPSTLLKTSGLAVGLPKGYQGNSEVGHLTIGSGRIINQSLQRINKSIRNKNFFKNKEFLKIIKHCKTKKTKLHIIGLLQEEGVHAHINHLFALLDLCKKEKMKNVLIHVITDGRDSPPKNGIKNLIKLEKKLKELKLGEITTISGRYYSMDRDKRWDRTKKSYEAIVNANAKKFKSSKTFLKEEYEKNNTDEFIIPHIKENYKGINENEGIIFFNYRTDRPRQLTKALVENNFKGFKRKKLKIKMVAMTEYYKGMNADVAFKSEKITNILGEIISKNKLRQLRISETEKYAHVTFFFNGQKEKPYPKEDRILIPSPKVATYDLKPEMSVEKIAETIQKEIKKEKYHVIITNLVNGDMVGHTGITSACKKAVKSVDKALKKIVDITLEHDGTLLIFADHGNVEDQTEKWKTSHTINDVPFILVTNNEKLRKSKLRNNCGLKDVAPTALKILKIKKPKEMTGQSIIK